MCGICNLFRLGNRRSGNGCGCNSYGNDAVCERRTEPRMNVHCASGVGTASSAPCGCRERSRCGCERNHNYDYDNDCHNEYYENPYCD